MLMDFDSHDVEVVVDLWHLGVEGIHCVMVVAAVVTVGVIHCVMVGISLVICCLTAVVTVGKAVVVH